MSRSNPTVTNPSNRYFKWSGGNGKLVWWDKDAAQEVEEKLPFRFVVLDELSSITGWSDSDQSGIWSNEIRNLKEERLNVKVKAGTLSSGLYEHIKDSVKAKGGKYARSVYVAYQIADGEDGTWTIGNIKMSGAAMSAWFDFHKKIGALDREGIGVVLTGSELIEKNKSIKYHEPTFELFETNPNDEPLFAKLDQQLQDYLEISLNRKDEDRQERGESADPMNHGPLPTRADDVVLDDIDDKPIDLSEIPF